MNSQKSQQFSQELEAALHQLKYIKIDKPDCQGLQHSDIHFLLLISKFSQTSHVIPSEIAKHLGVTMSAITHHINRLEEQGYIERLVSQEDKRSTVIHLTEKGKKKVSEMHDFFHQKIQALINYLGEEDSVKLIEIINKVIEFKKIHQNNK